MLSGVNAGIMEEIVFRAGAIGVVDREEWTKGCLFFFREEENKGFRLTEAFPEKTLVPFRGRS